MTLNQVPAPARRPDAARNRDKILAAARTAFADPRADVSMAEVARRAGVGMATLYRNFPGRRELLEALFADEVDAICAAAEAMGGAAPGRNSPPGSTGSSPSSRASALSPPNCSSTRIRRPYLRHQSRPGHRGGPAPLHRREEAGQVRDDLTLEQALDLVIAIATIHQDSRYVEPILQAALDGLRPQRP